MKWDGREYLKSYPELQARWINQCSICGFQGYKPEMEQHLAGDRGFCKRNLMHYFSPLELNELGMCRQCAKSYHNREEPL